MGYPEFRRALSPTWLRQTFGNAWSDAFGDVEDGVVTRTKESVKASFPSHAPADALPAIGADLSLERGPAELEASFRARLLAALDAWKWAGTAKGLLEYALAPTGLTDVQIVRNRDWDPAPPDGNTAKWARVWIVINAPHPWEDDGEWGDGDDGLWTAETTETWGSTATTEDVTRVHRLVRTWLPARCLEMGAYIRFGAGFVWGDGTEWGDGSAWTEAGNTAFWDWS